jgi:hypothetical protein
MKDFWIWAGEHYFLTFLLAWSALAGIGQFFRIFQRSPKVSDEQLQTLQQGLLRELSENRPAPQVTERENSLTPITQTRARPWYDRLR